MTIDLDKNFPDKEGKVYKMKKLLSLLIVLTINGTAAPTTIATSPYEKLKNKVENSKRSKRTTIIENGKLYWVSNNEQAIKNNEYLIRYINVPILSISLAPNNASSSKAADVWIATQNGVYYRKNNKEEIVKVSGLDEAIQDIKVDNDGGALIQADILRVIFRNSDQPSTSDVATHDNNDIAVLNKIKNTDNKYVGTNYGGFIVFGVKKNDPNNLYQDEMYWYAQGVSVLKHIKDTFNYTQSLPYSHYFDENNLPRIDNSFWVLSTCHRKRKWRDWFNREALPHIPINALTDQIYNSHTVRILFLIAINFAFNSCHQNGSDLKKRNINQNLNKEFCDLQSNVSKIKGNITSIQILDKNTKGGNIQNGDAYIGATEGLYLISNKDGNILAISNIQDNGFNSIVDIKLDSSGGAYVLNNQGKYFHLISDFYYMRYEKIESSNLEKEIKLFYDFKKENHIVNFAPTNSKIKNFEVHTINLGPIKPNNYKKIEFLGDVNYGKWGTKVSWGDWNYTDLYGDHGKSGGSIANLKGKNIVYLLKEKNNSLKTVILNKKVTNQEEAEDVAILNVQIFEDWGFFWGVNRR